MPQQADYTILQADFRETLAAVRDAGGAALIATSPPYPDARTCYESLTWEDYQALGDAVKDALLPGGHCLLNLSAPVRQLRDGHGTERDLLPFRLLLNWADRVGLTVPDDLIFGRRGFPGAFPERFRRDHEPLWWFRRPGMPLPLYKDRILSKARTLGSDLRVRTWQSPSGRDGTRRVSRPRTVSSTATAFQPELTEPGSVWEYGVVARHCTGDLDLEAQNHPARWPYRLAADIVACFSDVGDLVCDPFLGGGTTLAAACDGGRRFIGGDLSEEWAEKSRALADRRYSQMTLSAAI